MQLVRKIVTNILNSTKNKISATNVVFYVIDTLLYSM